MHYLQQFRVVVADFPLMLGKKCVFTADIEASVVSMEMFHIQRKVRHLPPTATGKPIEVY